MSDENTQHMTMVSKSAFAVRLKGKQIAALLNDYAKACEEGIRLVQEHLEAMGPTEPTNRKKKKSPIRAGVQVRRAVRAVSRAKRGYLVSAIEEYRAQIKWAEHLSENLNARGDTEVVLHNPDDRELYRRLVMLDINDGRTGPVERSMSGRLD